MKATTFIAVAVTIAGFSTVFSGASSISNDLNHPEQVDKILEKLDENQQEIKIYLSMIAEKLNVTLWNTTVDEDIFAENSTEVSTEQVLEPEEIIKLEEPEVTIEPPALDLHTLEAIQETYPRCSKASNLVEDGRLNRILGLASSSRFSHLSQPAIYNAILDSILTPSPLVCTQDYVRLAYKVLRNKKASSSLDNLKEEWAWLKARFQPKVFDLFESKAWKIMSVAKPGFGFFATNIELPGVPEYSCLIVKRIYDNSNAVKFRFSASKTDGANFRVVSVLTNSSYQLFHLCRTGDCDEVDSRLLILPTTDFVLGNNSSAPMEFRIAQVSFARMAAVASHAEGFWGLPFTMRLGTYTFREAGISTDQSSKYLFYLG